MLERRISLPRFLERYSSDLAHGLAQSINDLPGKPVLSGVNELWLCEIYHEWCVLQHFESGKSIVSSRRISLYRSKLLFFGSPTISVAVFKQVHIIIRKFFKGQNVPFPIFFYIIQKRLKDKIKQYMQFNIPVVF